MAKQLPGSPAVRALLGAGAIGQLVAYGTGTTHATANTQSLVSHGAVDENGNAYLAANLRVIAIPTVGTLVYQGGATTATQIDVRSTGSSIAYAWYLFVVN